ncbi:uncharacterized protein PG986_014716 [Apiospora aurea]|uniref:Uncharacterized protein n=1 Tax=Apiospora aurea TaxID=335848 RepID=A0ABR1PTS6_9PEZI
MDDLNPFKSFPKPLPLIHINGDPGVGKLTVARRLQALLNKYASARLVEMNRLVNQATAAVIDRAEPGYHDLGQDLRFAVFEALAKNPATHHHAYIFTDSQTADLVGAGVCAEYVCAARQRRSDLISVVLSCDEEAHLKRVGAADRVARGGTLVDASWVKMLREKTRTHRFNKFAAEGGSLELDVTDITPMEAADRIFRHILDVCPEMRMPAA